MQACSDLIDAVKKNASFSCFSFYFSMKFWLSSAHWVGWMGSTPGRPVRTGESAIRTNQTLAFSETWRISTRSANMPSPLTSVPPWIGSAFSASTSAFVGVHQRQLYCFCMVRLFRVFLRPPVCTPGGIVKVCLGSCVFTHPRPQRWPHHATDREASTCVWRFPKWPGLETSHTACAAFQQSGPALRLEERGGEWGGAYWQGPAMFSEAQTSGSIAQYDGEKCLLLMKASSVSRIGLQPERHYVTEIP